MKVRLFKASLAAKVFALIILLTAATMLVLLGAVRLAYEDMAATILQQELPRELEAFSGRIAAGGGHSETGEHLQLIHDPLATDVITGVQGHDFPVPFQNQIRLQGRDYLALVQEGHPGAFLALRDITLHEVRERRFQRYALLISALVMGLSSLLAWLMSRRISHPLEQLTREINRRRPGTALAPIHEGYQELEFREIARTFNHFLQLLQDAVRREKNLVNMASHELRTPLAVISGAVDVLSARETESPRNRVTLERIRHAVATMRGDIDLLLQLARSEKLECSETRFDLQACVDDTLLEIQAVAPQYLERVQTILPRRPVPVALDYPLLRMVLRNLLLNALHHTEGVVELELSPASIVIRDHGDLLHEPLRNWVQQPGVESFDGGAGLGLYIVKLVCERLGWRLRVSAAKGSGNRIELLLVRTD